MGHAVCGHRGFDGDRRFMVVDSDGVFLTQRDTPELGLIEVFATAKNLSLRAEGREQFALQIPSPGDGLRDSRSESVTVWSDTVEVIPVPIADAWLSDMLGKTARLVYMPDSTFRETSVGGVVSFADGYPYLITNTASLLDLNRRLAEGIDMRAFRSNIVVRTEVPWVEDTWKKIGIGSAVFELISPCVRCKVTTLDPDNPLVCNSAQEPLRTLSEFRRDDVRGGVTFGWNAMCLTPGVEIEPGDSVSVID